MKDFTTTKETLVRGMRYAGFASMADLHARVTLRNKTMLATARQELDDHGHRLWPVLVYRGLAIYPMGHHDRRGPHFERGPVRHFGGGEPSQA